MKRYINCKPDGRNVETVDELDSGDYGSIKEFYTAVRFLLSEYRLAFVCQVWASQKSTKEWAEA